MPPIEPARTSWPERLRGVARVAVPVAVVAVIAIGVWRLATDTSGARRETAPPPLVALTPPPPPPPPPPKERPPEPEKTVVETSVPSPTPKPEPAPKSDAPKQLTINGPPQAGADAFGVAAGRGGGVAVGGDPNGSDKPGGAGGGFAEAGYARYLDGVLQRAVQADNRINRLAFTAQVQIWIRPDGAIARVEILRSSGDERTDKTLIAAIQSVGRVDQAPPPQIRFPARVVLRGRKT
ncbi:ferric siderophore transporter TonB [Caulobacter flavus]|uniref:Ferric siderophore transporter TonB n=1 Tax=Caulobacter flavus TaxID=1679497 RepID=A0A2N5CLX6_9CAUL|nr:TonB family protein [Caulobacter flavus]AYV48155.1 ferric siderophore transporter TonB [Caulobacter flavus]PLR06920.1 ferric siderophore transporter TonB [Caulobacter flavus]